ncbi:MAG TPA: hypothetical protein VIT67_02870 [Povalibacter sp.]
MRHRPALIFAAICVIAVGALAGYLYHAAKRSAPTAPPTAENVTPEPAPTPTSTPPATTVDPLIHASPATVSAASQPPTPKPEALPQRVFFRHNGVGSHYGSLAYVDLSNTKKMHFVDTLQCEAVHVSGGHGICLSADRGVFTTYAASLFDAATFKVNATFPLKGIPSRSRVSADGTLAALTVFVTGHGYSTLDFSTQTLLIDFSSGTILADLETFMVRRDGAPVESKDFNFWGVTFTPDAKNFYATLSTAGKHYLIRGDIAARTADVIRENVECPSLSPDARHVAYKKRFIIDNRIVWQLHVLNVENGAETALSEKRSIDDQLEWLGDRTVLYSVPSDDGSGASTDVWSAPIDASAPPRLFLRNAYSPATARNLPAAAAPGT